MLHTQLMETNTCFISMERSRTPRFLLLRWGPRVSPWLAGLRFHLIPTSREQSSLIGPPLISSDSTWTREADSVPIFVAPESTMKWYTHAGTHTRITAYELNFGTPIMYRVLVEGQEIIINSQRLNLTVLPHACCDAWPTIEKDETYIF